MDMYLKLYYFSFTFYLCLQVPNSAIKECRNYVDFTGKEFLDPTIDKTVKSDKDLEQ
jgi:hypothetical protein